MDNTSSEFMRKIIASAFEKFEIAQTSHLRSMTHLNCITRGAIQAGGFADATKRFNDTVACCVDGLTTCNFIIAKITSTPSKLFNSVQGDKSSTEGENESLLDDLSSMSKELELLALFWQIQSKKLNHHETCKSKADGQQSNESRVELGVLLLQGVQLFATAPEWMKELTSLLKEDMIGLEQTSKDLSGNTAAFDLNKLVTDAVANLANTQTKQEGLVKRIDSSEAQRFRNYAVNVFNAKKQQNNLREEYQKKLDKRIADIANYKPQFVAKNSPVLTADSSQFLSYESYYHNAVYFTTDFVIPHYDKAIELANKAVALDQVGKTSLAQEYLTGAERHEQVAKEFANCVSHWNSANISNADAHEILGECKAKWAETFSCYRLPLLSRMEIIERSELVNKQTDSSTGSALVSFYKLLTKYYWVACDYQLAANKSKYPQATVDLFNRIAENLIGIAAQFETFGSLLQRLEGIEVQKQAQDVQRLYALVLNEFNSATTMLSDYIEEVVASDGTHEPWSKAFNLCFTNAQHLVAAVNALLKVSNDYSFFRNNTVLTSDVAIESPAHLYYFLADQYKKVTMQGLELKAYYLATLRGVSLFDKRELDTRLTRYRLSRQILPLTEMCAVHAALAYETGVKYNISEFTAGIKSEYDRLTLIYLRAGKICHQAFDNALAGNEPCTAAYDKAIKALAGVALANDFQVCGRSNVKQATNEALQCSAAYALSCCIDACIAAKCFKVEDMATKSKGFQQYQEVIDRLEKAAQQYLSIDTVGGDQLNLEASQMFKALYGTAIEDDISRVGRGNGKPLILERDALVCGYHHEGKKGRVLELAIQV